MIKPLLLFLNMLLGGSCYAQLSLQARLYPARHEIQLRFQNGSSSINLLPMFQNYQFNDTLLFASKLKSQSNDCWVSFTIYDEQGKELRVRPIRGGHVVVVPPPQQANLFYKANFFWGWGTVKRQDRFWGAKLARKFKIRSVCLNPQDSLSGNIRLNRAFFRHKFYAYKDSKSYGKKAACKAGSKLRLVVTYANTIKPESIPELVTPGCSPLFTGFVQASDTLVYKLR